MGRARKTNIRRVRNLTLWRECGYCGATVRAAYCSQACVYAAQMLRDVEARGVRRRTGTAFTSEWEDAAREARLAHVCGLVRAGCTMDEALDAAGFPQRERPAAERQLYRRGLRRENPLQA